MSEINNSPLTFNWILIQILSFPCCTAILVIFIFLLIVFIDWFLQVVLEKENAFVQSLWNALFISNGILYLFSYSRSDNFSLFILFPVLLSSFPLSLLDSFLSKEISLLHMSIILIKEDITLVQGCIDVLGLQDSPPNS